MKAKRRGMFRFSPLNVFLGAIVLVAIVILCTGIIAARSANGLGIHGLTLAAASEVGMSVAVASNEFNTLALQFRTKDQELSAREQAVQKKEASLSGAGQGGGIDTRLILVGLLLVMALVAANFYFDYRRAKAP